MWQPKRQCLFTFSSEPYNCVVFSEQPSSASTSTLGSNSQKTPLYFQQQLAHARRVSSSNPRSGKTHSAQSLLFSSPSQKVHGFSARSLAAWTRPAKIARPGRAGSLRVSTYGIWSARQAILLKMPRLTGELEYSGIRFDGRRARDQRSWGISVMREEVASGREVAQAIASWIGRFLESVSRTLCSFG